MDRPAGTDPRGRKFISVTRTDSQRALYFPDIAGKALTGAETHTSDLFPGKVSLVSVLNTRISEEHVQGFVEPVLEDWEGSPHFRYIQVSQARSDFCGGRL